MAEEKEKTESNGKSAAEEGEESGGKEKEIIEYASKNNAAVNNKAIALLKEREDYRKIIDELLEEGHFILSKDAVEGKIVEKKSKIELVKEVEIHGTGFKPLAKEVAPDLREIRRLNLPEHVNSGGKAEDFVQMFRDKFRVLEGVLKQRNTLNAKPIKRLKAVPMGKEVEIIGMVQEKFTSKNENLVLKLEDLEAECIGVVSKDDQRLVEFAKRILPDNVVGVKGKKIRDGMIVIREIMLPELPQKPFKKSERNLSLAAVSDFHVGSKLFMEEEFKRFLLWLKGMTGSEKEKEKVGKIKYLMILGDVCDGIAVYPNQLEELAIKDIYGQYEALSELLVEVPEYIEVVMIPGQHDAVRWSDPQNAIPKEFLPELHKLKNFHFISSPGWVEVEGLKCLMYHGPSMHDLYASVSNLSYKRPHEAMIELLKRRDLMPSYGMKRPYIPEKMDYMVIREEPDIFLAGEMHHNSYGPYRGTMVMSCGTWQLQTDFQVQQGHTPTPGIASIYEMKTNKIIENYFYRKETEEKGAGERNERS